MDYDLNYKHYIFESCTDNNKWAALCAMAQKYPWHTTCRAENGWYRWARWRWRHNDGRIKIMKQLLVKPAVWLKMDEKLNWNFFGTFFLPTSVVFSGWHICIWLTSIAIQIFKYAANFGIASSTFFSASSDVVIALPVNYTIWVIFQVQGSLSFSNRTSACLAKPCLRMLEKFETKLFLLLRLFLWLRHSVEIHVQSHHL